jgi:hypothetical protein
MGGDRKPLRPLAQGRGLCVVVLRSNRAVDHIPSRRCVACLGERRMATGAAFGTALCRMILWTESVEATARGMDIKIGGSRSKSNPLIKWEGSCRGTDSWYVLCCVRKAGHRVRMDG